MKVSKSQLICTLIYLVGFGIICAVPINSYSSAPILMIDRQMDAVSKLSPSSPPSNGETVGIIVAPTVWTDMTLQGLVGTYKTQLESTGYQVLLHTSAIGGGTVQELRSFLQNWYSIYGISGVVLIGNLAYAQYYHPASSYPVTYNAETFVCDLFLTDLDGIWTDTSPTDGIYDGHSAGSGDIEPEIYLGRIDASTRTLGGLTNIQNINSVLNRVINYRLGLVSRTHQAITYIDDDWKLWADGTYDNWPAWLNPVYSTRTDVHTPTTYTNATDWASRLTQNYEWVHLCAHSGASPPQHYFGPGGVGEGTFTSAQIHSTQPTFNFYNLYCCHGADYITTDCLATTYLYSSSYSLGVIGSTKTGGMLYGNYFYSPLGQDKTIGQALHDWFQGIQAYDSYQYLEWFYGMTLLGDPFLTTDYDCTLYEPTVISITHPNQASWYSDPLPQMGWSIPVDVNGIAGYYYIFDQNPLTNPTTGTGTFTAINNTISPTALSDGTWYFHLLTVDGAGNEVISHYTLNIDTTGPSVSINTPSDNYKMAPGTLNLTWTVTDGVSGYDHVDILLNSSPHISLNNPITQYSLDLSVQGNYMVTVQGFNGAGLTASDSITINVIVGATIPPYYYIIGGTALVIVLVVILIVVKRKKKAKLT